MQGGGYKLRILRNSRATRILLDKLQEWLDDRSFADEGSHTQRYEVICVCCQF